MNSLAKGFLKWHSVSIFGTIVFLLVFWSMLESFLSGCLLAIILIGIPTFIIEVFVWAAFPNPRKKIDPEERKRRWICIINGYLKWHPVSVFGTIIFHLVFWIMFEDFLSGGLLAIILIAIPAFVVEGCIWCAFSKPSGPSKPMTPEERRRSILAAHAGLMQKPRD